MLKLLFSAITGVVLLASPATAQEGGGESVPLVKPKPPGSPVPQKVSTISFKNNCNRPVQIAVGFKDASKNSWQKKAWYSFAPNEGPARLSGVETRNRYVYYYAETTDNSDSDLVWSGDHSTFINDRLYRLQEIDLGGSVARWTQTLSCPKTTATKSNKTLLLAQATKEPVANQQPPEELPPVVPANSQKNPAVVDKPKEATQTAPASPKTPPPAKGEADTAVVEEERPPASTPEASPAPTPTSTP